MKGKSFFFIALLFIASMVLYFTLNPSYEKSLEAKFYFEMGDYKEAYSLAKEAFERDRYNKMAATIMTQSQYALKYVLYIEDAKRYIKEIETLTSDQIDDTKRAKVRMIASIMVESYQKLAPSVAIEKELIEEAKAYYEKFQTLLQKAHRL